MNYLIVHIKLHRLGQLKRKIMIKAFKNNVLMRRLDQEKTVKPDSLILAPDNQINKNIRCEVLSVGKGLTIAGKRIKLGVKPGDIVIVRQWSGTQVMPLEDKSLIIDKID